MDNHVEHHSSEATTLQFICKQLPPEPVGEQTSKDKKLKFTEHKENSYDIDKDKKNQ